MGRRYIVDTHTLVFALSAPKKLGAQARAALERVQSGRDQAWVPAAVVAEVVLLRELGRTNVGMPEVRTALSATPALQFLPLDMAQLSEFSALSTLRDPFDRLIVSAARAMDARLITKDSALAESPLVETVWS